MKRQILVVLIWGGLLLSTGLALAQPTEGSTTPPGDVTDNRDDTTPVIDNNTFDEQAIKHHEGGYYPARLEFKERLPYAGRCDWLPAGSICLIFSDGYRWIVHDYWIDYSPMLVGSGNCLPIELIRGYYADYYHILGTSLVACIPRQPQILIKAPPELCQSGQCHPY